MDIFATQTYLPMGSSCIKEPRAVKGRYASISVKTPFDASQEHITLENSPELASDDKQHLSFDAHKSLLDLPLLSPNDPTNDNSFDGSIMKEAFNNCTNISSSGNTVLSTHGEAVVPRVSVEERLGALTRVELESVYKMLNRQARPRLKIINARTIAHERKPDSNPIKADFITSISPFFDGEGYQLLTRGTIEEIARRLSIEVHGNKSEVKEMFHAAFMGLVLEVL